MAPIAATYIPHPASLTGAEGQWAGHGASELTDLENGAPSTLSLFSSLFPSGGLHVTFDESSDGAQAVGKSDGLPQELVEVVGGVAATVAFTTAAFTLGPVALPAAIASAPTAGTSFFAAFLGI